MKKVRQNTYYFLVSLLSAAIFFTTALAGPAQADAAAATQNKVVLASGKVSATELYIIDSGKPGPVVMIVGGIHGNEKAGAQAASKFTSIKIKKGKLLVLPQANKRALAANKRTAPGGNDFNRSFPLTSKGSPDTYIAKDIYKVVKNYKVDWLMDMHEGFDYYKNPKTDSVGQSLIHYPSAKMTAMAKKIINTLNKDISKSSQKFTLLKYPVKGSLARSSAQFLGVNAFIFETSMKQTLSTRVNQQQKAANTMLKDLGMI